MKTKNKLQRIYSGLSSKALLVIALSALMLTAACSSNGSADSTPSFGTAKEIDFYNHSLHEGKLAIRYIDMKADVKSGDAILITTPDGQQHYLIDAGIPEGGPQIDEVLRKLGIERLTGVINTHPHIDHIGGLTTLLHTRKIERFYHNGIPHTTETYSKVHTLLKDNEVPLVQLTEGDVLSISPDAEIEVLNPPAGTEAGKYDEWGTEQHNNHSLVLMLRYIDNRVLLTGDVYKSMESDLIERYGQKLQADLMHAPHHGDQTSSSGAFIRTVNPEIAVFSANTLQSLNILQRYEKNGVEVYTTGLNGQLLFVADGKSIQVYPEKEAKSKTKS